LSASQTRSRSGYLASQALIPSLEVSMHHQCPIWGDK
jgi:hypothetical protein